MSRGRTKKQPTIDITDMVFCEGLDGGSRVSGGCDPMMDESHLCREVSRLNLTVPDGVMASVGKDDAKTMVRRDSKCVWAEEWEVD